MVLNSICLRELRLRCREWGLLAEVASNFFAGSVTEKGDGGNVRFPVMAMHNVAVVLQNRALDATKLGVKVKATALEDIQLVFSSGIHYSLRIGEDGRSTSFFLIFLCDWKHPPPFPKNAPEVSQGTGGGWFLVRIPPFLPLPLSFPYLSLYLSYYLYPIFKHLKFSSYAYSLMYSYISPSPYL